MSIGDLFNQLSPVIDTIEKLSGNPDALDAEIRKSYGYLAWALDVPDLKGIIEQAVKENWDPARIQGALETTPWWQQHTAAQRQWAEYISANPADADPNNPNGRAGQTKAQITAQAAQLGVTIAPDRLSQMALDSLQNGWNADQLRQAIAYEFHYDPNAPTGAPTVDSLKASAKQYLVPLSDQALGQWAQGIIGGTQTADEFTSYLREQAKSLFPTMAAAIDKGTTPDQYLNPYRQTAAQLLEISPDQVDFMDPKWSKAINTVQPDGTRAPLPLYAWQNELRTNQIYGYDRTDQARTAAADLQNQLEQHFGVTGTTGSMV